MDGALHADNDRTDRNDNERDRRARRRRASRARPPRRWLWLGAALLLLLPPPGAGAPLVAGGGGGGAGTDPAPGRSPGPPPGDDPLERWCGGGAAEEYEDNAVAEEDYAVTSVAADAASASSTLSLSSAPATRHALDGPDLILELTHPLFATSHGLLPGLVYTVRVSRPDSRLPAGASVWVWSDAGAVAPPWDGVPCLSGAASRLPRAADNASFTWAAPPGPDPSLPPNVTFRARYADNAGPALETSLVLPLLDECELRLSPAQAEVSWLEVPAAAAWGGCRLRWPGPSVLVTLVRLNAACDGGGRLRLGPRALCGKLQELPAAARTQHLPPPAAPLLLAGRPRFALRYRLVDACYDQRLDRRNGSLALDVPPGLDCTFRLLQPYGQRVRLELAVGRGADDVQQESEPWQTGPGHARCDPGVLLTLSAPRDTAADDEGGADEASGGGGGGGGGSGGEASREQRQGGRQLRWALCAQPGAAPARVVLTAPANAATLRVVASPSRLEAAVPLRLRYAAVADAELEAGCGYGWSALSEGRCAAAMAAADADQRLSWPRAQQRCRDLRGHLVSVASPAVQQRLDRLLRATHSEDADVAYWIGATDRTLEGDFHWSDGQPFLYSNWFPQQPNDDALSEQNCVEARRSLAGHRDRSFRWNDRSCAVRNAFVCQRRRDTPKQQPSGGSPGSGGGSEAASEAREAASASCRRSVRLSREAPRSTASSPGFPRHYPDNADCLVDVAAPAGYRIVVDFEELVLEDEPTCSYDYLQILEPVGNSNSSVATRRLCGDWSSRLKKLRYVSQGPALQLRFFSDYSHHYSGYKARISMEQAAVECADERLQVFNSSCYLFVSYPQVSWQTARQTCQDRKAELASIGSAEEQSFVTASIRNSPEYSTAAVYWLGGRAVPAASPSRGRAAWLWAWADGAPIAYSGWLREQEPAAQSGACLGLQWVSSPNPQLPSGLYWQPQRCSAVGGYVCKRSNQVTEGGVQLNRTVNGTEGFLTSPNFPGGYGPNLDYWVRLAGPPGSRLVLRFTRLDLEPQQDCLYDYIELRSVLPQPQPAAGDDDADVDAERAPDSRVVRCGRHDDADLHRLNFVSESNEALLHFHSDYSVSGGGFSASWQAVDVSGCPLQTLTAREGSLTSPNYPHFLLAHLDCATTILAPAGRRVWLEFSEFSVGGGEALLEVDLGGGQAAFQPFQSPTHLTDGVFLSVGERLQVRLRTADRPTGAGFSAVYRTVGAALERRVLRLASGAVGSLLHLNWPRPPPPQVDLATLLVAPPAHTILLELHHVALALAPTPAAEAASPSSSSSSSASGAADAAAAAPSCPDGAGILEVRDSYADSNGTAWLLCEAQGVPPLAIASYLNTLTVRQRGAARGVTLNATVRVQPDANYKLKLLRGSEDGSVESCNPNPCLNGGRCLSSGNRHSCQCTSHYTGMFCALTLCELEPCLHGQCRLTEAGYTCHCQPGFTGATCDRKQRPCADNPCEGRGECLERGDAFHCRCHAWWEGQRCERRMMHIPFKPLSERMLQEPFWLGLITVTVVLLLIGLVWCAKRHFPEKLEKLLAEEADRSRSKLNMTPRSLAFGHARYRCTDSVDGMTVFSVAR